MKNKTGVSIIKQGIIQKFNSEIDELKYHVSSIKVDASQFMVTTGIHLLIIKDKNLYKKSYGTWDAFCEFELSLSGRWASNLCELTAKFLRAFFEQKPAFYAEIDPVVGGSESAKIDCFKLAVSEIGLKKLSYLNEIPDKNFKELLETRQTTFKGRVISYAQLLESNIETINKLINGTKELPSGAQSAQYEFQFVEYYSHVEKSFNNIIADLPKTKISKQDQKKFETLIIEAGKILDKYLQA